MVLFLSPFIASFGVLNSLNTWKERFHWYPQLQTQVMKKQTNKIPFHLNLQVKDANELLLSMGPLFLHNFHSQVAVSYPWVDSTVSKMSCWIKIVSLAAEWITGPKVITSCYGRHTHSRGTGASGVYLHLHISTWDCLWLRAQSSQWRCTHATR